MWRSEEELEQSRSLPNGGVGTGLTLVVLNQDPKVRWI